MDKNRQPGISFDDIILKELIFSRKDGFSDKPVMNIKLNSTTSFSQNEDRLIYEMSCEIVDENGFFDIKCTMLGFFSIIAGKENMNLKEYSELSAPAAIYPYIKEVIASTTIKAGIPPVIIPPTNLLLLKKKKQKISQINNDTENGEN